MTSERLFLIRTIFDSRLFRAAPVPRNDSAIGNFREAATRLAPGGNRLMDTRAC